LYFLLKYDLPPVLFTLTQVVLLLITSTFTRVQIQSNLGTTGPDAIGSMHHIRDHASAITYLYSLENTRMYTRKNLTTCVRNRLVASLSTSCNNVVILSSS
jgi:hypothetical protein